MLDPQHTQSPGELVSHAGCGGFGVDGTVVEQLKLTVAVSQDAERESRVVQSLCALTLDRTGASYANLVGLGPSVLVKVQQICYDVMALTRALTVLHTAV